MQLDDFARRLSQRPGSVMWFLGAGASASAGIATASNIIAELKQLFYISQKRVEPKVVADLTNPAVRLMLQDFIDSAGNLPSDGAANEYSELFERVLPSANDRQAFLDKKLSGAKPSSGHIALASMMKAGHINIVWTTNFDPLVNDACAKLFDGTGPLTTIDLDSAARAAQAVTTRRWPLQLKLHGDFRSSALKNTTEELKEQDATMRAALLNSCIQYGLVIVGYAGHDASVMKTLMEAVNTPRSFPHGLYWLHRGSGEPYSAVAELLAAAEKNKIECGLIHIENFDETMRDVLRLTPGIDAAPLEGFGLERELVSAAPFPIGRRNAPVIRLNGLEVLKYPQACRKIVCSVGGVAEVRQLIETAGFDVLATRSKHGVLAFGEDEKLKALFQAHNITEFGTHPIDVRRMRYESHERGLLREAIGKGIARQLELVQVPRRVSDLFYPKNPKDPKWAELGRLANGTHAITPAPHRLEWREGFGMRLDWAGDSMCLLIEPRTIILNGDNNNKAACADFNRERYARRYNSKLNDLVAFWAKSISASSIAALGVSAGIDASFELSKDTSYSCRLA